MSGTSQTIRDGDLKYFAQYASDLAKEMTFGSADSKDITTSNNNLRRIKEWDIQSIQLIHNMEDGARKVSPISNIQKVRWKYQILINVAEPFSGWRINTGEPAEKGKKPNYSNLFDRRTIKPIE